MIPEQTVADILGKADVVDVISEFINLKKRGVNYLGLCPFHNEKTGSFTVSPAKQIYKCFGCGKSGNAVTFLMDHEKWSYPEALRWLAKRYGIEIIEEGRQENVEQAKISDSLYAVNNFAAKWFAANIGQAKQYLEERRFTATTAQDFQLGYNSGTEFTAAALRQQFTPDILIASGLSFERNNELRDTYRNRLIIPIFSTLGKITGFAARVLGKPDKEPKYINTPENDVYNKSKMLFGLYQAKQAIAQANEAFVVEGHLDVITLHQSGIKNSIASGGTALTPDQLKLLRKWTSNIVLIDDGDAAGIKASIRAIEVALAQELQIKIVQLPADEDPDSFIKKYGGASFREYIAKHKVDFVQFQISTMFTGENKTEVVQAIAKNIAFLRRAEDFISRQEYIRGLASKMQVDEQGVIRLVDEIQSKDSIIENEAVPETPVLYDRSYQTEGMLLKFLFDNATASCFNVNVATVIVCELEGFVFDSACKILWDAYVLGQEPGHPVQADLFFMQANLHKNYQKLISDFKNESDFMQGMTELMRNEITALTNTEQSTMAYVNYFKVKKLAVWIEQNMQVMTQTNDAAEQYKCLKIQQALKQEQVKITSQLGITIFK